jgi:DNA polymerase/3'-5' exonuclease PolX
MRSIAKKKGFLLNEHHLQTNNGEIINVNSEKEVFDL